MSIFIDLCNEEKLNMQFIIKTHTIFAFILIISW